MLGHMQNQRISRCFATWRAWAHAATRSSLLRMQQEVAEAGETQRAALAEAGEEQRASLLQLQRETAEAEARQDESDYGTRVWAAYQLKRTQLVGMARQAVCRWVRPVVSRAFRSMVQVTSGTKKLRRAVSRMRNVALGRSFGTWKSRAKTAARGAHLKSKVVARLRQLTAARVLTTWRARAVWHKRSRRLLKKIVHRWTRASVTAGAGAPHNMGCPPKGWPESPRIVLQCTLPAANGPDHLGLWLQHSGAGRPRPWRPFGFAGLGES